MKSIIPYQAFIGIALCCLLSSCAVAFYGTFSERGFPPKPPDFSMRLLEADTTARYEKICIIAIYDSGHIVGRKQLEEDLKKHACLVGADIVIRTEMHRGDYYFLSGTAVRFIK